eukprot:4828_1
MMTHSEQNANAVQHELQIEISSLVENDNNNYIYPYIFDENNTYLRTIFKSKIARKIVRMYDSETTITCLVASGIIWLIVVCICTAYNDWMYYYSYVIVIEAIFWIPWYTVGILLCNDAAFKCVIESFDFWIKILSATIFYIFWFITTFDFQDTTENIYAVTMLIGGWLAFLFIASIDALPMSRKIKTYNGTFAMTIYVAIWSSFWCVFYHMESFEDYATKIKSTTMTIIACFMWKQAVNTYTSKANCTTIRHIPHIVWIDAEKLQQQEKLGPAGDKDENKFDILESVPEATVKLKNDDDDNDSLYDPPNERDIKNATMKTVGHTLGSSEADSLQVQLMHSGNYHIGDTVEFNSDPEDSAVEVHTHHGQILTTTDNQISIQLDARVVTYFLDEIKIQKKDDTIIIKDHDEKKLKLEHHAAGKKKHKSVISFLSRIVYAIDEKEQHRKKIRREKFDQDLCKYFEKLIDDQVEMYKNNQNMQDYKNISCDAQEVNLWCLNKKCLLHLNMNLLLVLSKGLQQKFMYHSPQNSDDYSFNWKVIFNLFPNCNLLLIPPDFQKHGLYFNHYLCEQFVDFLCNEYQSYASQRYKMDRIVFCCTEMLFPVCYDIAKQYCSVIKSLGWVITSASPKKNQSGRVSFVKRDIANGERIFKREDFPKESNVDKWCD